MAGEYIDRVGIVPGMCMSHDGNHDGKALLVCPYCGGELARHGGALSCAKSHSFDLARNGYVNLDTGRHPGDTKEMLLARRAFLDDGHYLPLSLAINQRIAAHLLRHAAGTPKVERCATILDAGCGEGYYTRGLSAHLATCPELASEAVELFGLDISRDGIRMAANRRTGGLIPFFIAADLKTGLPFRTGSLQVLFDVFAPRNPADFARVLVPGGLLLVVIPGPDHLKEVRERLPLLNIEKDKHERVLSQFSSTFSLQERYDLRYELSLAPAAIDLLMTMTPTRRQVHPTSPLSESLRVTASFILLSLIRLPAPLPYSHAT